MKTHLEKGNMHAIAKQMGSEQDYLQNGDHWSGKWDIDLYMAALEQSASAERIKAEHSEADDKKG